MNRFQKGLLSSSWEFSITLKFPEISVGIKIKLSGKSDPPPKVVISGRSVPTKTYSSPKILASNLTSPSLRKKKFSLKRNWNSLIR